MSAESMKALVELMARGLVATPDAMQVKELAGEGSTVYELSVAPEDLGKVIGKKGRTARAMRTILQAAGSKSKVRAILEILD
jgi:predicted RNA-binding protein YlqC (UPF0109 family)